MAPRASKAPLRFQTRSTHHLQRRVRKRAWLVPLLKQHRQGRNTHQEDFNSLFHHGPGGGGTGWISFPLQ